MKILAKNLMILASAGSGKTFQLGNRVIGKIGLEGIAPERIVALTFTRKAAGEFADSVLTKLADGALDSEVAAAIKSDLKGEVDIPDVLRQVVNALPRLQLTTLDGFFSRIVRGFQYELGVSGGTFDLLEGERKKTVEAEILEGVLRDGFENREDFYYAFRRVSLGRGQQGVQRSLENFVKDWRDIFRSGVHPEMFQGTIFGDLPAVDDWATQKDSLINSLRRDANPATIEKLLDQISEHTVGKSLKLNVLGNRLFEHLDDSGPITVKNGRSDFEISAGDWNIWRNLFTLAIRCELSAAVARTAAVGEIIAQIDHEHERQLRSRGLLSFDDIKVLLSEGMRNEEARLRRELVDYRLDGRYDHWLLDEFQDTSPEQWRGLESLIDEAVSDPEGGLFVVGDRKQGIYAWRGGDVSLFDDLIHRYNEGLEVETMDESYRSCPAVLDLVNSVCGDGSALESLFGKTLCERWQWEDHLSAKPKLTGEAKVVVVEKDGVGEAMIQQLRELGIGKKKLSCGVLVRSGAKVREYADLLRAEGFDVIEAGQRKPCQDHAVGVVFSHFIKWLADPADEFSRQVVAMSPLDEILEERFPGGPLSRWQGSLEVIQVEGYARFLGSLIESEWAELSEYGRRRAGDLISVLSEFDDVGDGTPRAARDWIKDLEVNQAPGVAAIQIMTIHKSKGLGFDVVMLPEISDEQLPNERHFAVARGPGWLLQNPGKWARDQIPELREARDRWAQEQLYEATCVLYVALTRAKQGLYLYLPKVARSRKNPDEWKSLANLVRITSGEDFQSGDPHWADKAEDLQKAPPTRPPKLKKPIALRQRINPSSAKEIAKGEGGVGKRIGMEVHALFEKIAWLAPGEIPDQPLSQAGKIVEDALKVSDIHRVFEDDGARLYREQGVELILDDKWMSGVVDRLHVYPDHVEIYDFKSDAVEASEVLLERYCRQMEAYRRALTQVFDQKIECYLVSTYLGEVIQIGNNLTQGELAL